ncbi:MULTISPECIES: alpha/beta fold hydrolase [unclassified Cyanobium]|uniref:alpha/beta fold hydrolase n=1 Tax=unclassified Cyanobium TaxID=2627006 RepID=UPI0020CF008E|nr:MULTISPECIES: alpha/beta fold hydrolase [unclassified Cyanobium]MCP9833398.1 alpha/beta fold hydrolase [Cyanobium sp. La Preciosa 7G6]MCP9936163.1 alpha/beta fold hydrolase [Cyanobium sp. Aljojuca 7A6]
MASSAPASLQVIAMHGWAGDGTNWTAWQEMSAPLGWLWACGERGYGPHAPRSPAWEGAGRRVVIGHSMGPHLLDAAVLAGADAVVLLAGFGRFVPPGAEGRKVRAALAAMAAQLAEGPSDAETALRAQTLLRRFLIEAASPDPAELLPPGPADQPVSAAGRARLRQDLALLERCDGLPAGFPSGARVLIVEAEADRIVGPQVRALLRQALPQAEVVSLAGAGHCLLRSPVMATVLEWLQGLGAA